MMNPLRISAVILSLALLGACSAPPPPADPVRPLRIVQVGAGGTAHERIYSGEVRPRLDTTLAFQVGGKILERRINVGDKVQAGQVLARLDPKDLQLAAQQAEAQQSLAAADVLRYRDLRAKGFVSQAVLDAKQTALTAANAQLDLARNQLRYAALATDQGGVVGQVLAEPGQVVAPGQPVLRLAPDGDREIAISIPETEYSRFKLGQRAKVEIYSLPERSFEAVVREIAPSADPATRTYAIRLVLSGQKQLPTGLTATVRFATEGEFSAIAIPLAAVYQDGPRTAVWVLGADDTVSLRAIQLAGYRDDHALVTSGLTAGERIAAAGVHRLHAGQKVRPVLGGERASS